MAFEFGMFCGVLMTLALIYGVGVGPKVKEADRGEE